MAGCSSEEEWGVAQKSIDEINASMGTEGSRTAMNGNSVVWSEKDAISVFTQSGSDIYNNKYDLKKGAGSGNATFSGQMEGENPVKMVALYPYAADATYGNGKVTLTMKSTYEYAENSNNSAPMACQIKPESSSTLAFKNAGALMSVTVNNIPAGYNKATLTSKTATDNSGTPPTLTGKAEITFDTEGNPTLGMTKDGGNGNVISITFTGNASGLTNKTFYFPIPVAEYPALEMAISKSGNDEKVLKTKALKAERSQRYTTTITLDEMSGNVPTEVKSVTEVTNALTSNNSVSVTDVSSTETAPTITLPDKAADNMSISLEKISTTSAIKVAGTSNATNVAKKVLISAPQPTSDQQGPKFDIDLPKSTVTLAANGEKTTYEEVTATTNQNTLIVGKGVTVKKLIVKGGNVRVNKGGTVTEIVRDNSNSATVIVYKEEGATLPALSGNTAFEVLDAAIADLQNVAKEGGTYTLTQDLMGDFTISATDAVTINLNGHKITNKEGDTFTVNKGSTLTISGNGTIDNINHGKACIYNNGTVVLNGGTYTRSKENGQDSANSGGNSYYNILNHGVMTINSGVEVLQGGQFSSMIVNGYYGYTNEDPRIGYVSDINHQNPSLIINGGTFSGGFNTIKNDDGAQLTIIDGTFTNMSQATVQNHHVTEIKGGTFNTTGSAKYAVDNEGHNGAANDLGQMTISGGTLNGKIHVGGTGASLTVTGGTFSDPNVLTSYLAKEANVKVRLDKGYTGPGFGLYEAVDKKQYGMHATIEVDLNNHTWNVLATPLFGSTGYESQYFHLERGAKVTFKNGTVKPADDGSGTMLIQNYCDLTLEDLTLVGGTACQYVISNNNGTCNISNTTVTAATGMCAFDVYSYSTYTGIVVNVTNSTINGKVEFDGDNNKKNGKLTVAGGTMNGNLVVNSDYYDGTTPNIIIDNVNYGNNTGWGDYLKQK